MILVNYVNILWGALFWGNYYVIIWFYVIRGG